MKLLKQFFCLKFILSILRLTIHKLQHSIIIFNQKVRHFSGWDHKEHSPSINNEIAEFFLALTQEK